MSVRKQPRRAFPYYGSKVRIAKFYPEPKHSAIVEPFAGAAAYSQRYWERDVYLFDVDQRVIDCWNFLISASARDILALPDVEYRLDLRTLGLSPGEKSLMSYYSYDGFAGVKNRLVGKRCLWNRCREPLSKVVHHFDHWKANLIPFQNLGNVEATWFIDPPYQFGGEHYDHGTDGFEFSEVAAFARSRLGQVIVCENTKADWLPFRPLVDITGVTNKKSTEAIWTPRILDQIDRSKRS